MKEISREKLEHEDFLKNSINSEVVLEILTDFLEKTYKTEDKNIQLKAMKETREKLKDFYIISLMSPNEESSLWVQYPITLNKINMKLNTSEKLNLLFREGILAKKGKSLLCTVNVISNTSIPIKIRTEENDFVISDDDEVNKFFTLILYLIYKISTITEENGQNIGIFKKPYDVIASNGLQFWMEEQSKEYLLNIPFVEEKVNIHAFLSLFDDSEIHLTNNENKNLEYFKIKRED